MNPFFIIGCARSGTTLLRVVLNNHSMVAVPQESLFLLDYLKADNSYPANKLLQMLVREPEILEWGLDVSVADFANCTTVPEIIFKLHEIYVQKNGKKIWGQKTPRFIRELDLISEKFPTALFIHIIRDPRAVASSLIRSDVHRSTAYHAAKRWLLDVNAGLNFEANHAGKVLRIAYEDLVRNQDSTMQKISAFLGIDYELETTVTLQAGISKEYSRFYANLHSNLSRSITDEFVEKWMSELSKIEVGIIDSICSSTMRQVGYERIYKEGPGAIFYWQARAHRVPGMAMQVYQYMRYRRRYIFYLLWRKSRLGLLKNFLWELNR